MTTVIVNPNAPYETAPTSILPPPPAPPASPCARCGVIQANGHIRCLDTACPHLLAAAGMRPAAARS